MSLADMYEKIAAYDEEQYEELSDTEKTAAEYDAAGRIMARGFADELNKLAEGQVSFGKTTVKPAPKSPLMKSTGIASGPTPKLQAAAQRKPKKSTQLKGL